MNISLNVDVFESPADLNDDIKKLILFESCRCSEQIISANKLADDEPIMAFRDSTEIMNTGKIWMAKTRQGFVFDLRPFF